MLPNINFNPKLNPKNNIIIQIKNQQSYNTIIPIITQITLHKTPPSQSSIQIIHQTTHNNVLQQFHQKQQKQKTNHIYSLKIHKHNLQIKLIKIKQIFDTSKLLFNFTTKKQINFQKLIHELTNKFNTQIKIQQIKSQNKTQLLNNYNTYNHPLYYTT